MIKRYNFGNPIETDAILCKPDAVPWQQDETGVGSRFGFDGSVILCKLIDDEIVYGLGENIRGINKRGWIYESNNTDDPHHTEDKRSLYGAHNFLILDGGIRSDEGAERLPTGIFIDTPGKVTFNIGYTKLDELVISFDKPDFELYVITPEAVGDNLCNVNDIDKTGAGVLDDIVHQFRTLIGRSYIPPRWAFGMGQCRWSYMSADEVREVAKGYRDNGIPLDMIYLDIDYMERYKDFTVNSETFPDFEDFVSEMRADNIHLIPIIDGGVKVEEGYDVYEEGRDNGYFCKDENGEDFIVGVWPGRCCFPDMLNDKARRWFGQKYKVLLDMGIDGFWNDMNEPAIFYSERRMKRVFDEIGGFCGKNLDLQTFSEFQELVGGLNNNPEDYASFYHNYKGERYCNKDVHNLYGYYMTRSAGEAFDELSPDRRILMFSRSSYIGMHRYGGIWQGDNFSWWSHLLMNIKMMPSLNMCGFLYTGADIGGFNGDVTEDLLIRWLSFGVFTPLMRNHSALGTRRQEPYRFENIEMFRDVIKVRYKLLPYIYSEYMKAALRGTMMFRPLGFVYDDEISRRIEDQLLVGDSIMIAPVYEQNAVGRVVYCPEPMKVIRFSEDKVSEEETLDIGYNYVNQPLGDVCVFLRENKTIPISAGGEDTESIDYVNLTYMTYGDSPQPYDYYTDDGETKEF